MILQKQKLSVIVIVALTAGELCRLWEQSLVLFSAAVRWHD